MAGPFEKQIITSGDMSQASGITSSTINLDFKWMANIQAVWTGSPVGTLQVYVSNDSSTWTTLTGATQAISGSGDVCFVLTTTPYKYVKCAYTKTSGTGTLNATIEAKGA